MLTSEQRDCIRKGIIQGEKTSQEWFDFINDFLSNYELHLVWQKNERLKNKLSKWILILSSVISIITGFLFSWWLLLCIIPSLVWFFQRKMTDSWLYFVAPIKELDKKIPGLKSLINVISKEVAENTKIKITYQLYPPRYNNLISSTQIKKNGGEGSLNIYKGNNLILKTIFLDKTSISLSLGFYIKETIIVKRSKSGRRYKRKEKYKSKIIYMIKMGFHEKIYTPKLNNGVILNKKRYELKSKNVEQIFSSDIKHQFNMMWEQVAQIYAQMDKI
ncbi:MAG: hypothetical protein MUC49_08350 [Raineya sp.]|jgi:hypothetical protein|nr:hypothetical protein [Raineya sp.]